MIIGAVVLAAGKSERMGQNKLFLSLNGKALIDNILDAVVAADISEQVIVLGHKPEQVIEAIKPRLSTLKIAVNEAYICCLTWMRLFWCLGMNPFLTQTF
jgi:molybdenum cofactor cytidylyltransferase